MIKTALQALDALSLPAFAIDKHHRVIAWNGACARLTGVPAEHVIGTDGHAGALFPQAHPCLADLVLDNAIEQIDAHFPRHGCSPLADNAYRAEGWVGALNGKRRYLVFEARLLSGEDGVEGAVEVVHEITEHKRASDQLQIAASVFENASDGIMITDPDDRIVSVNKAFQAITGYGDEILGQEARALASDRHSADFYRNIRKSLRQTGKWQGEIWSRRQNGQEYLVHMQLTAVRQDGRVANHIGVFRDVTRDKEAEDRITHLAHHDFLTGLPNRILLEDRISQAIARAEGEGFAVAFLDLDKFKLINDALGHATGDRLLKEVARRLKSVVRSADTVSRLGGDEFVLLLTGLSHPHDVAQVAGKVLRAIAAPYHLGGHRLSVTASIGLSLYPADGQTPAELITNADTAMYHAKGHGRKNYQFFTENLNAEALESLLMENSLQAAIPGQLFVEYQPQLCLLSRTLYGVEALVRWQHPGLGLVSPGKFIPLAEETGLIEDIGQWVLGRSLDMLRRTGLRVAVNLSPVQLADASLPARVRDAIAGADAGKLTLEVTESAFISDFDKTKKVLEELKKLGVTLALDDFGTGYSSLSYLNRLPFDTIKIDQAFVRDENSHSIVLAIIGLAEKLGMGTIAEGVETAEQMAFLERAGCATIQGFHFARPLDEARLAAFISDFTPLGPALP